MQSNEVQRPKFVLTAEEYDRFALAFEHKIKEEEKKCTDPDMFDGVPLNQMIETVMLHNLSFINSMDDYNQINKILRKVADRLIKHDQVLIVSEDNEDPNLRKLKIHPNYVSRFD